MCLCGVGGGVGGNVRAARHGLINRARTSHAWGYLGMGPGMLERRDVRAYKSRPYIPALQQCAPIYSQPCRVASTAACVRSRTCIFCMMWCTCDFAVSRLMESFSAMARLVRL